MQEARAVVAAKTEEPKPAPKKGDWQPPVVDPVTNRASIGGYPANHRLRAIALNKAGKSEDPQGLVTPEQIAAAKD